MRTDYDLFLDKSIFAVSLTYRAEIRDSLYIVNHAVQVPMALHLAFPSQQEAIQLIWGTNLTGSAFSSARPLTHM